MIALRTFPLSLLVFIILGLAAACGGGEGSTPGSSAPRTTLQGRLATSDGGAVIGATIRTASGSAVTLSAADGRFSLVGIPASSIENGRAMIVFDSTAAIPASTFRLKMPIAVLVDGLRALDEVIRIPAPKTTNQHVLHGLTDETVRAGDEHSGASITIAPGSLDTSSAAVPNGVAPTVSMTYIPRHQLPGPMPNGMTSNVVFSVQPSGAIFDPHAAVSFPNYDGFLPGEQVPLMQVDPTLGEWVRVGTCTVNGAGTLIVSDPGSGARWGSCTGCCYSPCFANIEGTVTFTPRAGGPAAPAEGVLVSAGASISVRTDGRGQYLLENVPRCCSPERHRGLVGRDSLNGVRTRVFGASAAFGRMRLQQNPRKDRCERSRILRTGSSFTHHRTWR